MDEHECPDGPKVAVVNRTLAAKYFADGQAIGRHFGNARPDVEIVGIVDDGRLLSVQDAPVPSVFFPLSQRGVAVRQLDDPHPGRSEKAGGGLGAKGRWPRQLLTCQSSAS